MFTRKNNLLIILFLHFVWTTEKKNVPFHELLENTIRAVEKSGEIVLNLRKSVDFKIQQKKSNFESGNEIVTTADLFSNHNLKSHLKNNYPLINFLSEEEFDVSKIKNIERKLSEKTYKIKYSAPEDELYFIVDPLDATLEYSENLLKYSSVMACVLHLNVPIMGVIHFPYYKDTFYALLKTNHSKNFEVPYYSNLYLDHMSMKKPNILVSRSHTGNVEDVVEKLKKKHQITLEKAGGAGFKAVRVLLNTADMYVHSTVIKIWDICSPYVIAKHFDLTLITDLNLKNLTINLENEIMKNGIIFGHRTEYLKDMLELILNQL